MAPDPGMTVPASAKTRFRLNVAAHRGSAGGCVGFRQVHPVGSQLRLQIRHLPRAGPQPLTRRSEPWRNAVARPAPVVLTAGQAARVCTVARPKKSSGVSAAPNASARARVANASSSALPRGTMSVGAAETRPATESRSVRARRFFFMVGAGIIMTQRRKSGDDCT